MIRYRCAGCGFVLVTVRLERDRHLVVEFYNGKIYRGCLGVLTPKELAMIVKSCPKCGRELSTKPTKIVVKSIPTLGY